MNNTYNNEIEIDFTTGEVQGNKHMEYIDRVFDTMDKDDAKEAIKGLVSTMLEIRDVDRDIIKGYDELLEETNKALMEALNLLSKQK